MNIKVQVTGTSATAGLLREHLTALGYAVVERGGRFSVCMDGMTAENPPCQEFGGEGAGIESEAAAGEFGDEARRAVAELCGTPVCWRRSEMLQATELRVVVPVESGKWEDAAVRGVLRAILKLTRHGEPVGWFGKQNWRDKHSWLDKFRGRKEK